MAQEIVIVQAKMDAETQPMSLRLCLGLFISQFCFYSLAISLYTEGKLDPDRSKAWIWIHFVVAERETLSRNLPSPQKNSDWPWLGHVPTLDQSQCLGKWCFLIDPWLHHCGETASLMDQPTRTIGGEKSSSLEKGHGGRQVKRWPLLVAFLLIIVFLLFCLQTFNISTK